MNKATLLRLLDEAQNIAWQAGRGSPEVFEMIFAELLTEERKNEGCASAAPELVRNPPGARTVNYVTGKDWDEIMDRARIIAGCPGGKVTFAGEQVLHWAGAGKWYARSLIVTPAQKDDRFSEEELMRAARDLSPLGVSTAHVHRLVAQVRKNRSCGQERE